MTLLIYFSLFLLFSMVCLAALNRLPECLSMVSQHLVERLPPSDDVTSKNITTDIYVLRARIHAKLGNVSDYLNLCSISLVSDIGIWLV